MVASRAVLAFALLSACSFRANPGRGDDGGSGSGDGPVSIDAPIDARIDGAPGAAKMKMVTITTNKIGGAVSAFPVWFTIADPDLSAHATMSGSDIYFTKTDGTALPFERAKWTKSTGHLEAWVLLDLDPAHMNVFEVRYGDPGVSTNPNPAAVFASANGFVSVWHFEDSLAATAVVDTVGTANGTASGFAPAQQVPAQLGGGFSFNGGATQVAFTNQLTLGTSSTISAWVKLQNTGFQGFASIITIGDAQNEHARFVHAKYNNNLADGFYGDDQTGGPDVSDNNFHLVHWTYDANANKATLFKDATVASAARTPGGAVSTSGTSGLIGNSPAPFTPGGNTSNAINGILDEVRIANVPRTQAWITTEFNNQNAPAMFYTLSAEMQAN